jgi:hypothetical protein
MRAANIMTRRSMSFHTYAVAMLLAILAGTATAHQHGKPDDPAARVAPPARVSVFDQYQRYREEPTDGWRDLNDEVARVGGHIGIVRGDKPAATPPATEQAKDAAHSAHQYGSSK